MPQLDLLIVSYEFIFIVFFMIGYFFFLKNFLSIIAFELKIKNKLEIYFLSWINKNLNNVLYSEYLILNILIVLFNIININTLIISTNKLLYGLYRTDLLLLLYKYNSNNS
jgi:hypothetical protein